MRLTQKSRDMHDHRADLRCSLRLSNNILRHTTALKWGPTTYVGAGTMFSSGHTRQKMTSTCMTQTTLPNPAHGSALYLTSSFSIHQGFFDEYVGACLLWMKINVMPIVPVEDMALVQVRRRGLHQFLSFLFLFVWRVSPPNLAVPGSCVVCCRCFH